MNINNPGDIRTRMHVVYDDYVHGVTRFPRYRFRGNPEDYPRRTQPIARALFREWAVIDEDRLVFRTLTDRCADKLVSGKVTGTQLVVNCIGRNAVRMMNLTPGEPPQAIFGEYDRNEFAETFEGTELTLTDGSTVVIQGGIVIGSPEAALVRTRNATGFFMSHPTPEPVA